VPEIEKRRKKPFVIEVLLWDGTNFPQILEFAGKGGHDWGNARPRVGGVRVIEVWNEQEQAWIAVPLGHRVARGALGEFYPMSPQAYEETTEPAA